MTSIPVVFIESETVGGHGIDPPWFQLVRMQAQSFSDNVVWLGNNQKADVALSDYRANALAFVDQYVHLSRNHLLFESFCFQRWFILLDWMRTQAIDVVLHLDSDVLLFCDPQQEWERHWQAYPFTLALGTSAATSFITRDALEQFCSFVYETYADRDAYYQDLERIYAEMLAQDLPGGINDMTLWREFTAQKYDNGAGEMTDIRGGATWDHNINTSDGYTMINGVKDISIENGIPFARFKTLDKLIRFNALHFQGGAKNLIPQFAYPRNKVPQ